MRHFAITGMETVSMISRIFLGDAMRATPPWARICAGTRSSAITAAAPAFSAISAWRASVTSMITPPLSISAKPVLSRSPALPFSTVPPPLGVTVTLWPLEVGLWAFAGVASFFPRVLDIANSCAVCTLRRHGELVGLNLYFTRLEGFLLDSSFCFVTRDDARGNSVPGKHLLRINGNERSGAARQNFPLGIA